MNDTHSRYLSDHLLYRGDDVDDARGTLSTLFSEVAIDPFTSKHPYSALVNGIQLPHSSISYCEYQHGMIAAPRSPLDFHTIQLNLSGKATFQIDDTLVQSNTRQHVMLSSNGQVRVHHHPGNSILSFIVGDEVIQESLHALTGKLNFPQIRFSPVIDPANPGASSTLSLFQLFVNTLDHSGDIHRFPAAISSFEDTLVTNILLGLEHNLSDVLRIPTEHAGERQVKQAEEYMEAHAAEPITMVKLARETGHSANSIYRAFRKFRDYTPMQFLLEIRMRTARNNLLFAASGDSVTKIALQCGFTHLGRFSIDYKSKFGESPSKTLHRSNCRNDL